MSDYNATDRATTSSTTVSRTLPALTTCEPVRDEVKLHIATLEPKYVKTIRRPQTLDAWQQIQRIESVDVVPVQEDSNVFYTIRLHFRHDQSRLPTAATHFRRIVVGVATDSTQASDVATRRSFEDYQTLRDQIWEVVRNFHPVYCELCDGLAIAMCTKLAQVTLAVRRSPKKRAASIAKYLQRVMDRLTTWRAACIPDCRGQYEVPLLLHGFLLGADETVDTRP